MTNLSEPRKALSPATLAATPLEFVSFAMTVRTPVAPFSVGTNKQKFAGDVVLMQVGAFVEQLQWPPRRLQKVRPATARTPRGGLRRMRPTRRGAVQGFPLTQLDRRVAGLVAAGRSVTLVGQLG